MIRYKCNADLMNRYGNALKKSRTVAMAKYSTMAWCSSISTAISTVISVVAFWYWLTFTRNTTSPGSMMTVRFSTSIFHIALHRQLHIYEGKLLEIIRIFLQIFLLLPGAPLCFVLVHPFIDQLGACIGITTAIHEVISKEPVIDSHSKDGTRLSELTGRIEFKNARFAYPSRINSLVINIAYIRQLPHFFLRYIQQRCSYCRLPTYFTELFRYSEASI